MNEDLNSPGFDNDSTPLPLYIDTYEERIAQKIKDYEKIASRYDADTIIVGAIVDVWEDYKTNRISVVVSHPVQDSEFTGMRKVECFMELNSPLEVASMTSAFYTSRTLVVDRDTKKIIAAYSTLY